MNNDEFYEDDERAEEILERFEAGEKHVTARPVLGVTQRLDVATTWGPILSSETSHTNKDLAGL
ncbi:hypothetical protein RMT89_04110 [Streptomyces sp. P17]|nr:hypothetical protein [Streptomyces sp. P17]